MSNIDKITAARQLFVDLTPEEGSTISGGATFYLGNKSGIGVNYTLNGQKGYLSPGQEYNFSYSQPPVVIYDKKIGAGYEPIVTNLAEGKNNFDRNGNDLILTTTGPIANLT